MLFIALFVLGTNWFLKIFLFLILIEILFC